MKRTPIRKVGKKRKTRTGKAGITRLSAEDMRDLRWAAYIRSNANCELRVSPKCWGAVTWQHGELSHCASRGSGGSDVLENVAFACRECHRWLHNGGKPCPKKPTPEELCG